MKKTIIVVLVFSILLGMDVSAAQRPTRLLTINLLFPQKSTARIKPPQPKAKAELVSGAVFLDIRPYPKTADKNRYLVEYFLEDKLLYRTTGWRKQRQKKAYFAFIFDSTKYPDGQYKLIVNFWDESGPSAIGIRKIMIDNHKNANE